MHPQLWLLSTQFLLECRNKKLCNNTCHMCTLQYDIVFLHFLNFYFWTFMVEQVKGDLLDFDSPTDLIVQQCNCITLRAKGLCEDLGYEMGVMPYQTRTGVGNIADESSSSVPGTASLHWAKLPYEGRVACLYAQYTPGSLRRKYECYERVKRERGILETERQREQWFEASLNDLAAQLHRDHSHVTSTKKMRIAFPKNIGCGLAGGKWAHYKAMIEAWAAQNPQFKVVIVEDEDE